VERHLAREKKVAKSKGFFPRLLFLFVATELRADLRKTANANEKIIRIIFKPAFAAYAHHRYPSNKWRMYSIKT
jgi:hypothetical protein